MAQAPAIATDIDPAAVEKARHSVKRLQNAARDASRHLARLDEELRERGLDIDVIDNDHGPETSEGEST